jgi:hypothetical protein
VRKAFGGHRCSFHSSAETVCSRQTVIPENDRGNNQIEPTGLVLQILAEPIANRTATVKENRPSQ